MIVVLPKIALGVTCGLFLCCKAMPVMADQPGHNKYRRLAFRLDDRQQSAQWLAKCLYRLEANVGIIFGDLTKRSFWLDE